MLSTPPAQSRISAPILSESRRQGGFEKADQVNSSETIRWAVVAKESAFDQLKLDLQGPHILTRTPREKLRQMMGESDVVLLELELAGPGFDFRVAADNGLPVPFLLRSETDGQYIGVCRFGLHKEIFKSFSAVGEWWELRAGRARPYEVFRKMLNRVSDGIVELDADDRIRWVNTSLKSALPDVKWDGARLQDVVDQGDEHRLRTLRSQHASGVVVPFPVHLTNGEQVELDPTPWFVEFVGTSLLFRHVRHTVEQENRANELFCLYSLATALGQASTVEEALNCAVQRTMELLNVPVGGILFEHNSFQVSEVFSPGKSLPDQVRDHFVQLARNFPAHKKALVEREVAKDHLLAGFDYYSYAVLPVENGEQNAGALWLLSDKRGLFVRETVSLLISIVNHLSVIIENLAFTAAQLTAELEKKRFYKDALCAVTQGKLSLCERDELETAWNGAGESKGEVEILATADVPKSRHFVESALAGEGLSEERIQDAAICSTEAVGNVVKHADRGVLSVRTTEETVTIRIADQGPGIDFAHLPNAVLKGGFSTAPSLGMGYSILLEMMDHVHLSTDNFGTVVLLEIRKTEPDPLEAFAHLLGGDF